MASVSRTVNTSEGDAAKKRRVAKTNSSNEASVPAKATDTDLYVNVVTFEEKEASERSADEDAQLYYNICKEIKSILLEIAALKSNPKENSAALVKEKQIEASLKILILKKLNRLEKVRTKESRLALQKAREQVDSDHLHLQNMLYEVLHLTKEVKKCLEFKYKGEEMDLVPVEEFYANAPESVSKPEITKKNDHELKLARLQWELIQRKELAAQCRELEASKEAVAKDIESKKEQLHNLGPALKSILDATKFLQENLGVLIDKTRKLHESALLLPKALYVLYVQADAYSQVAKWMSVSIVGECDKSLTEELHLDDISSADSDSDNYVDTLHRRKLNFQDRRKSSGSKQPDRSEQKKKECIKKHPLSVILKITLKTGEMLSLEFHWLMFLEVVCVLPTISILDSSGIAADDLLSPRNLFSSLFPGDTGEDCPNPSTYYQLRRVGLDSFPSGNPSLGIPYRWAQELCGINLLPPTPEICVSHSQKNLENILTLVKNRFSNRLALAKEVKQLELGYSITEKKVLATLTSFVTITLQEFSQLPSSQLLLKEHIVDNTFIFYKASLQLNPAKLVAYIAVSPNYPMQCPMFLLEFNYKGSLNSFNCDGIRDIEREINVYAKEHVTNASHGLLLEQIRRLMFCIEIFAHIEYPNAIPVQLTYFRGIQGKTRSHPYRYVSEAGGMYTHR